MEYSDFKHLKFLIGPIMRLVLRIPSSLLFIFMLSSTMETVAQIDSLFIAPFKEEKSFTYGLNNRRTYFLNHSSTIYGAYVGIQYSQRMKHVITVNSNIIWTGNDQQQVRVTYAGFAEEYSFLKVKRFDFNLYTHIGLGAVSFKKMILPGEYVIDRKLISPLELGVHNSITIYDWLKLNVGAGYRFVFLNDTSQLNNFYYKIGVGVDIKKFNQFRRNKKEEQKS